MITSPILALCRHTISILPCLLSFLKLTDFLTTDLWQLNALCTALSCAMYHLDATGFQPLKLLAVSHAVALVLAVDSKIRADPTKVTPYILMDFKVQSIITLALMVLAFA